LDQNDRTMQMTLFKIKVAVLPTFGMQKCVFAQCV